MRDRTIKTDPKVENIAVLYLRYSSDNQNEQSIEGQRRDCLEYCKRNGIKVLDEYIDRAKTGTNANRPGFQKMVEDSSFKRFGKVIVWKSDRFSRDRFDALKYKAILGNNGVKLISVQEPLIEGPEGIILESVLDSMNQYYSEELSIKVKRGMHENVIKGKSTGGTRQFGYKIVNGYYQIDEIEGPAVQEAFRLYDEENRSILAIERELEKRGFRRNDGTKITYNTIQSFLSSERYVGVLKCSGQRNEHAIPPLVTRERFDRVQERKRGTKHRCYAVKAPEEYVLSGKMYCAKCGQPYLGNCGTSKSGKQYFYYTCRGTRQHKCNAKSISKELIENTIGKTILYCLKNTKFTKEIAKNIYEQQDKEADETALIKKSIAEINKKISNFMNAISMGIITSSTKEELIKLENQKKSFEEELQKAQVKIPKYTFDEIWYALKQITKSGIPDKKQIMAIINSFVVKVLVNEDGTIDVNTNIFGSFKLERAIKNVCFRCSTGQQWFNANTCFLYEHRYGFGSRI